MKDFFARIIMGLYFFAKTFTGLCFFGLHVYNQISKSMANFVYLWVPSFVRGHLLNQIHDLLKISNIITLNRGNSCYCNCIFITYRYIVVASVCSLLLSHNDCEHNNFSVFFLFKYSFDLCIANRQHLLDNVYPYSLTNPNY